LANALFFLGSGASAPFGIPTMKGLVDTIEKQLREESEGYSKEMYNLYQNIRKSLKATYRYVDLESIFSVIEDISRNVRFSDLGVTSAYVLSHSTGLRGNKNIANRIEKRLANRLRLRIKGITRNVCTLNYGEDSHIKEVFYPIYTAVASGGRQHYVQEVNDKKILYENWPIYTTNYDRVQEIYWEGNANLNDLITNDKNIYRIDLARITEPSLKLIKLHGSLDWYMLDDGSVVRSPTNRIRIGGRTVIGEMMLYPINQKDLYLHPWLEMIRGFKADLLAIRNWVVIGYSFNDLFIREIFEESLNKGNHRLIVVCPRASQIVQKHFGDRNNISPVDRRLEDGQTASEVGDLVRRETKKYPTQNP
jgi:SIR2-like domain